MTTTYHTLATEGDGTWDPREFTAGARNKVGWRCERGHHWEAEIRDRSRGRGCPYCAGQRVLRGFNDLATTNPVLASEGDETWDPREFTSMSQKKVGWQCEKGHHWEAIIANRSLGGGCGSCAKSGFDPSKSGWLYLMRNEQLGLMQIGISNHVEARMREHSREGFVRVDVLGPRSGHLVASWERDLRKHIAGFRDFSRKIEAKGKLITGSRKGGLGSREIWYEDELSVESLSELIKLTKA